LVFAAAVAVVITALTGGGAAARTVTVFDAQRSAVSGTWGTAEEVPGTAALNAGGLAGVESVSCGSVGNCSAGGYYTASSHQQAFVASEVNGTWGTAKEVPGTATLNQGAYADVYSVSCGSAGNCSAGGFYSSATLGVFQAFVASEVNGTWHTAKEVPGTAGLNAGGDARVDSVSCGSAGNCSAGGFYFDAANHEQALVVSEVNDTWGTAKEVPGTATLNQGGKADVDSLSCGSAGHCSAGGFYVDAANHQQALVVSEVNGTWGTAKEVPGTATLNHGNAVVTSVSCGSAGNCSAGGFYVDAATNTQVFVVSEVNGTWGTAKEVPGTATLNQGGRAGVDSLSCGSAGNCSAGGFYVDAANHQQAFTANEVNGTWGTAKEVPGTATLNHGNAEITSVSCGSAGNCSAGGGYVDAATNTQVFVASEVNGTWGTAKEVPGTAALNTAGGDLFNSVSCTAAGNCSAGGAYSTAPFGAQQAFVVSKS
jgi:hypothetical protein